MSRALCFTLSLMLLSMSYLSAQQFSKGSHFLGLSNGGRSIISSTSFVDPLVVNSGIGELSVNNGGIVVFAVSPTYGRFVSDQWLVGSSLSFALLTDFEAASGVLGVLPFARYYFNEPSDSDWQWFGQLSTGFSFLFDDLGVNGIPLSVGGGVSHFVAPGVSLDLTLAYLNGDLSTDGNSSIGGGATINIFLDNSPWRKSTETVPIFGRGTVMVGGSFGDLQIGLSEFQRSGFTLSPIMLYFLSDHFALGGGLNISYLSTSFRRFTGTGSGITTENINTTSFGLSPQARYYLGQAGKTSRWYLGGGFELNFNSRSVPAGFFAEGRTTDTDFNFAVGAGLNQFISRRVAFEFGPSLRFDPDNSITRIGVDLGIQVLLRE